MVECLSELPDLGRERTGTKSPGKERRKTAR